MSKSKEKKQNKFVRIITSPMRVLVRAKDMYIRSITNCGHSMNYSTPVDAAGRFTALPRSYSAATSTRSHDTEDFVELMRAASARTLVNRIDVDLVLKQQQQQQGSGQPVVSSGLSKSVSVGMGRIDEDKPFDFGDGDALAAVPNSYPRSRSYAVSVGNRHAAF